MAENERLKFRIEDWFAEFVDAMKVPQASIDRGKWPPSVAGLALEALSDASAEQCLNPITASHLRHYGQERDGERRVGLDGQWFWVRSEWSKVDISYGVATKPFHGRAMGSGWDAAWSSGDTGDIGQIETKVCYSHLDVACRTSALAGQLRDRRQKDHESKKYDQRYHGIVWLMHHGSLQSDAQLAWRERAEIAIRGTQAFGDVVTFQQLALNVSLGHLWPSLGAVKPYVANLDVALVELK